MIASSYSSITREQSAGNCVDRSCARSAATSSTSGSYRIVNLLFAIGGAGGATDHGAACASSTERGGTSDSSRGAHSCGGMVKRVLTADCS